MDRKNTTWKKNKPLKRAMRPAEVKKAAKPATPFAPAKKKRMIESELQTRRRTK